MRKEVHVLNDNTTMTIEHTTGRCDITITTKINGVLVSNGAIKTVKEQHEEKEFYWIQLEKGEWVIRLCVNGFCYNTLELRRTMTKKDAILTVIDRHTSKHWYDFGNNEECFATDYEASVIGKVVADFRQEEVEYIREYDGQHFKAYPNGYVFECDDIEEPKNTIKTEEEEEAENEHFIKQMTLPEYIGIEYTDARRFDNWKKYLFERIYEGDTEHDEMYAIISGDIKITGFFWNRKGAEQFNRLYGGKIYKIDSLLYYLYEYSEMYLGIINEFETYEISIESQLINADYLHKNQSPEYIFDTLQSYTRQYELEWILVNNHMMRYAEHMYQYCQMVFRDFANGKDCEKTLQAFTKNMQYLTQNIVSEWVKSIILRGCEKDESGKSVAE